MSANQIQKAEDTKFIYTLDCRASTTSIPRNGGISPARSYRAQAGVDGPRLGGAHTLLDGDDGVHHADSNAPTLRSPSCFVPSRGVVVSATALGSRDLKAGGCAGIARGNRGGKVGKSAHRRTRSESEGDIEFRLVRSSIVVLRRPAPPFWRDGREADRSPILRAPTGCSVSRQLQGFLRRWCRQGRLWSPRRQLQRPRRRRLSLP